MADRTVSVKLTADISDYTSKLAAAAAATKSLPDQVDRSIRPGMAQAGQRAATAFTDGLDTGVRRADGDVRNSGERSGGVLAQGLNQGLVRNSPLIVAGVAGALTLGAPAVLAASTAMFAGIGIAAAAQNDDVRASFLGLRDLVKGSLDEIGGPLADVLPGIADKIGASFQRMTPTIIGAMQAIAPQVVGLTDSMLQMAENALPGMATAAANAAPVMQGLGHFLEVVGTGIGDFFADLSEHSPAAGAAFASLGDIVAGLLPILSNLLGQGAELAAEVLPALAGALPAVGSALGVVADAAVALGPVLPSIVAGFIAMKAIGGVTGMITSLSTSLAKLDSHMVGSSASIGRAQSALRGLGTALPVIGIGVAAVGAGMAFADQEVRDFGDRMAGLYVQVQAGGEAAAGAQEQLDALSHFASEMGGDYAEAADQARAYAESLSPLEIAQTRLATAETTLTKAVHDHGAGSQEAVAASQAYESAQREVADAAAEAEMALHGVTQAMIDQANQALAAIDSGFAYQNSLNQLEDAQAALADAQAHVNDTNADTRTSTEDVERAQLALSEQSYRTALAFGQQQADLSGLQTGTAEYTRYLQGSTLQELYRLRDAAGPEMAGAIQQQIGALERSGVSLADATAAANTTTGAMQTLGAQRPTPVASLVDGISGPAQAATTRILTLGGQRPTPVGSFVDGVSGPASAASTRIATLGNQRANPVATLIDGVSGPARNAAAAIAAIQSRTVTITTVNRTITGAFAATGGSVDDLSSALMSSAQRRDGGGSVLGPGGPTDDLIPAMLGRVPFRLSNGEHVLDARDVQLMGGQSGVYRFRAALNSGNAPEVVGREWSGVAMSAASGGSSRTVAYGDIHVTANPDREAIARVVQRVLHEREALTSPWTG